MKLRKEITIDADRETVWRIFDDPEYTRKWQPALKSQTHLSGTPDEVGAKCELIYDHNGRDLRVVATLTEMRKFEFMAADLDSDWSRTTIANRFESTADNQTRWVLEMELRFKGIYKLVAVFFRKTMRSRSDNEMQRFKELVEGAPSAK
jgi:uncharacterized protein YndB with AHSA1/START domain